jgi:hypothetical protein
VAVTDSNRIPGQDVEEGTGYTRTLATDSLFTLAASPPVEQQIIGKRLYVRAVDNEGKFDPTPARAYFQSRNDCYPIVEFRTGRGNWVDKCGMVRERPLDSNDANAPTDTVGAGATICWSWGGSDCDVDGFITGYEYKLGSQPRYQGGTLADTSYCVTLSPSASRVQLLQVRAIDDGGLRSSDDFTQSVVVNFDPVTLVVRPPDDSTDVVPHPARVFQWNALTYPSGTTLPDNRHSVTIYFTGLDDPRDLQPSCLSNGLSRYQTRRGFRDDVNPNLINGGNFTNPPWEDVQPRDAYPTINQQQYNQLGSGDHLIMLRAIDVNQIVDSTPESIMVKVNYKPYLTLLTARPSLSPPESAVDLLARSADETIEFTFLPGDTTLVVTALGSDVHRPPPLTDPFDPNVVIAGETGILAPNGYRVFLRTSPIEPSYEMTPSGGNPFVQLIDVGDGAGSYTLAADVRDQTSFNDSQRGRENRYLRHIRIVRQSP